MDAATREARLWQEIQDKCRRLPSGFGELRILLTVARGYAAVAKIRVEEETLSGQSEEPKVRA